MVNLEWFRFGSNQPSVTPPSSPIPVCTVNPSKALSPPFLASIALIHCRVGNEDDPFIISLIVSSVCVGNEDDPFIISLIVLSLCVGNEDDPFIIS